MLANGSCMAGSALMMILLDDDDDRAAIRARMERENPQQEWVGSCVLWSRSDQQLPPVDARGQLTATAATHGRRGIQGGPALPLYGCCQVPCAALRCFLFVAERGCCADGLMCCVLFK